MAALRRRRDRQQPDDGDRLLARVDAAPYTYREFPKYLFHATLKPRLVRTEDDQAALGPGWFDVPVAVTAPDAPVVVAAPPPATPTAEAAAAITAAAYRDAPPPDDRDGLARGLFE